MTSPAQPTGGRSTSLTPQVQSRFVEVVLSNNTLLTDDLGPDCDWDAVARQRPQRPGERRMKWDAIDGGNLLVLGHQVAMRCRDRKTPAADA